VMYKVSPTNKRELLAEQIVKEIMINMVGGVRDIFMPRPFKQPQINAAGTTQDAIKKYVPENADTKSF
jgi:hypothetical protein